MLQDYWAGALKIGADAVPTAVGMAAVTLALARIHLETVEALMLAAIFLLIVLVL